ncbi:hypothetical protein Shyhy01_30490 [Streptomyces hygroscopicus subsp. hygroscopicus]|uniref:hypothetical protein n=1 Tax=Streptomyces sp. KHY 26 TaxID=3097359 RepID=UPI0024A10E5B|nr:hypothetical protein [Streptomyces hygroscopicus]GLX50099.1 hypothetical protein Shyhy01_30490 [Streptomyces hygroscopicus subsp. hygroscopicus]
MNHGPDDRSTEGLGPEREPEGADFAGSRDPRGSQDSFDAWEPDSEDLDPAAGGTGPAAEGEWLAPTLGGLGSDEAAVRRMLHSAVDGIEPGAGTLEHLRRAVPARRARKRQAAVGMAAAALFFGTAIPALVHVSDSGGSDPDTAMAGQSSKAQSGTGHGKDRGGQTNGGREATGGAGRPGKGPDRPGDKGRGGAGGAGTAGGADPSATLATGVPVCTAAELGSATGSAAAPDSTGIVYGTFRVTNISSHACAVGGAGTVGASAQGAADPAKIAVVRHAAGDAATGLPDPSQEVASLVLQPGAAYQEKFAFVPSETCPAPGGTTGGTTGGGPTPDPSPSASDGTADVANSTGTTPQLGTGDVAADGSVLVTHTAAGGPTAAAKVPGECAGTVYYTGLLADM